MASNSSSNPRKKAAKKVAATPRKSSTTSKTMSSKRKPLVPNENGVVLLSGGNPQIAKGDGNAPVQQYIAGMPGWKQVIGKQLDQLIEEIVPGVSKAVRWNSPFYGVEGQGWFLGVHCLTKYVKVTFFKGLSLRPLPPGGTERSQESRWIDIYEGQFDAQQLAIWIKQAAAIPGWQMGNN